MAANDRDDEQNPLPPAPTLPPSLAPRIATAPPTPTATPTPTPAPGALQTAQQALQTGTQVLQSGTQLARDIQQGNVAGAISTATTSALSGAQQALQTLPGPREASSVISTVNTAVSATRGAIDTVSQLAQSTRAADLRSRGLTDLAAANVLPRAEFSLELPDVPDVHFRVLRYRGREGLSEVSRFEIDVVTDDVGHLQLRMLRRQNATLRVQRGDHTREIQGVITAASEHHYAGTHVQLTLVLQPAMALLDQILDCAVYRDISVPVLVDELLRTSLADYRRTQVMRHLIRSYPQREMIVCFNETRLHFIQRLLSEEGIGFRFVAGEDAEAIQLFDDNTAFLPLSSHENGAIQLRHADADLARDESLRYVRWTYAETTNRVTPDLQDWSRPQLVMRTTTSVPEAAGPAREHHQYPAFEVHDYNTGERVFTADDRSLQTDILKQRFVMQSMHGDARGNAVMLKPGAVLQVSNHWDHSAPQRIYAVAVEHHGHAPEVLRADEQLESDHAQQPGDDRFHTTFTVLPISAHFRPPVVDKPRIVGTHRAVCSGPAGQEIYDDHHGRVKVKFHWDRSDRAGEDRSCWVRVRQAWAAGQWGAQWIPRIGMEVDVQFEEGDPDKPVVVGCYYNGEHRTPFEQPRRNTQSGWRTNSSPGGEGFHELRFDDAAGSEEIYIHCQRDFNEVTEHDHTTLVRNNESHDIRNCQSTTVGVDQSNHIKRDQSNVVDRDCSWVVGRHRSLEVTGNEAIAVLGTRNESVTGNVTYEVLAGEQQTIHKNRSERVGGDESLIIDGKRVSVIQRNDEKVVQQSEITHVHQHSNTQADLSWHAQQATAQMHMEQGRIGFSATGHGSINIGGTDATVAVRANDTIALATGSSQQQFQSSGTIILSATTEIRLVVGGSRLSIKPDGIELMAPNVTARADHENLVIGARVKIN